MLDAILRTQTEGYLAPVTARLSTWRVRADALTVSVFILTGVAVVDIGHRNDLVGLGFLAAARLLDGLDGPVARRAGATALGAYLDLVLDLVASAAVPFAFALADPERALAAMFLMLGLVARAGALAATARVASAFDRAGLLVGKSELFVAFAIACILPERFSLVAYAVGILCFVAAGSRIAAVAVSPPS